jgi:hypothetical protein
VFELGYSLLEYGVPLVSFSVEVFTKKGFEAQRLFEGDIEVFVWRNEYVNRRCKISSFEPRIPPVKL